MSYKTVARDKLIADIAQIDLTLDLLDAVPETEDLFVGICDTPCTWFRIQCGPPGDTALYECTSNGAPTCFYVRNPPPEFLEDMTRYLSGVSTDVVVVPSSFGSFGGGVYDVVRSARYDDEWDLIRADVPLFVCMRSYYAEPDLY